jgi:hypothetical protein
VALVFELTDPEWAVIDVPQPDGTMQRGILFVDPLSNTAVRVMLAGREGDIAAALRGVQVAQKIPQQ